MSDLVFLRSDEHDAYGCVMTNRNVKRTDLPNKLRKAVVLQFLILMNSIIIICSAIYNSVAHNEIQRGATSENDKHISLDL